MDGPQIYLRVLYPSWVTFREWIYTQKLPQPWIINSETVIVLIALATHLIIHLFPVVSNLYLLTLYSLPGITILNENGSSF